MKTYFLDCPHCQAKLSGKAHESLGINCTELYSDGKMICDEMLSIQQLVVQCPACSFIFWTSELAEDLSRPVAAAIDTEEGRDQGHTHSKVVIYPFSSWYLFGTNPLRSRGKLALIEHLSRLLIKQRPILYDRELYLRKMLLWAHNDLVRHDDFYKLSQFFKGNISFSTWWHERSKRLFERMHFKTIRPFYVSNIKRMIEMLRSAPEKEPDKVYLAELYRLKGNFAKSIEILDELKRSTHYVTEIRKRAFNKDAAVFKVAG